MGYLIEVAAKKDIKEKHYFDGMKEGYDFIENTQKSVLNCYEEETKEVNSQWINTLLGTEVAPFECYPFINGNFSNNLSQFSQSSKLSFHSEGIASTPL